MALKTGKAAATRRAVKGAPPGAHRSGRADGIYCIYLYYLSIKRNGDKELTAHYFLYYDHIVSLEEKVVSFIDDIAKYRKRHPSCYGTTFSDIRRRRVSYFVVVIEDDRDFVLAAREPLSFEDNIVEDNSGYDGKGRHTFDDFGRFVTPITRSNRTKTLQVVFCTNNLRRKPDSEHTLRDREQENFRIRLHFVSSNRIGRLADDSNYYSDSGGTNMGPPVPPPSRFRGQGGAGGVEHAA